MAFLTRESSGAAAVGLFIFRLTDGSDNHEFERNAPLVHDGELTRREFSGPDRLDQVAQFQSHFKRDENGCHGDSPVRSVFQPIAGLRQGRLSGQVIANATCRDSYRAMKMEWTGKRIQATIHRGNF